MATLAAAGAVFACLVAFAGAHQTPATISIKLAHDYSDVHGRIDSSKHCEGSRNVKLYYAFTGSTAFTKVSTDVTDSSGHWSVPGPNGSEIPTGQLYAKVAKRGNCAKAQSKTLKSRGA